jgi:hypothetical protein
MKDRQSRYIATVRLIGGKPVHVAVATETDAALVRCTGPADARQVVNQLNAYARERTR